MSRCDPETLRVELRKRVSRARERAPRDACEDEDFRCSVDEAGTEVSLVAKMDEPRLSSFV